MGDEGRGTVWEEIIVNAPKDVALVALSATVANVKEIADWISLVHRPIVPITIRSDRCRCRTRSPTWRGRSTDRRVRSRTASVVGAEPPRRAGGGRAGRWYTRRAVEPTVMIEELERRGWLPAIYFIFSRSAASARSTPT